MTTQEIIDKFRLQVDDTTELSSVEELSLADKVYKKILSDRNWSFLKTSATGTVSSGAITLPTNFNFFTSNRNYYGNTTESTRPVVFVGATYDPYIIINFDERRQYRDQKGYAYIDTANNQLVFTDSSANGLAYEFDYIKRPEALTLVTSPVFPEDYQHAIYHGMAVEDVVIQQSQTAKTYAQENMTMYNQYLDALKLWDSRQTIL